MFFDAQSQPQKKRILKLTPQNKRMLLRRQLYHSANASDGAVPGYLAHKKGRPPGTTIGLGFGGGRKENLKREQKDREEENRLHRTTALSTPPFITGLEGYVIKSPRRVDHIPLCSLSVGSEEDRLSYERGTLEPG